MGAQDVTVSSGSVLVLLLDSVHGIKWRHEAPKRRKHMECSTEPRSDPLRLSLDFWGEINNCCSS